MEADLTDQTMLGQVDGEIGGFERQVGQEGAQPGRCIAQMIGKRHPSQIAGHLEIVEIAGDGLGVADLWLAQDEAGCVEGNVHAANSSRICMTRWPASVPALAVSSPTSLKPTLANTLREPALLSKARDRRAG